MRAPRSSFLGHHPRGKVSVHLDAHAHTVRVEHRADRLGRVEVAAHQSQSLGQGHNLDHTVLDIRLLNDQSPARPEHAQQIGEGGAGIDEVVERLTKVTISSLLAIRL